VNVVWSGLSDDPDFTLDLHTALATAVSDGPSRSLIGGQAESGIVWDRELIRWTDTETRSEEEPTTDELQLFSLVRRKEPLYPAVLVQTGNNQGVLKAPNASVLSIDIEAPKLVDLRAAGENLAPGMLVVLPTIDGAGVVDPRAADGHYSRIWKECLSRACVSDKQALVAALRLEGIQLEGISDAVERWRHPATTVIHAPKQAEHFRALMKVLNEDWLQSPEPTRRLHWWQYAWGEIKKSRGEAIQMGFLEHQEIETTLLGCLQNLSHSIVGDLQRMELDGYPIEYSIPAGQPVSGTFRCFKVLSIESGYRVPLNRLDSFVSIFEVSQWQG